MLQVTEVGYVRYPEGVEAAHGSCGEGYVVEVGEEKSREMIRVKCLHEAHRQQLLKQQSPSSS